MKIGIFGDSFAFHHNAWPTESWITLLSKDFDVTSYGENGSSTFFSYKLLKEHYTKFDKIIFVITKGDRIQTSCNHIPSYDMTQYYLKEGNLNPKDREIIQGLAGFMLYSMADPVIEEQFMMLHLLLLKEIQSMGLDILFIRAFDDSRYQDLDGPSLWHITKMEQRHWGNRWERFKEIPGFHFDLRQCHMTAKNNEILYQQLKNLLPTIKGNNFFNFNVFDFAIPDDIDNYLPEYLRGKV